MPKCQNWKIRKTFWVIFKQCEHVWVPKRERIARFALSSRHLNDSYQQSNHLVVSCAFFICWWHFTIHFIFTDPRTTSMIFVGQKDPICMEIGCMANEVMMMVTMVSTCWASVCITPGWMENVCMTTEWWVNGCMMTEWLPARDFTEIELMENATDFMIIEC